MLTALLLSVLSGCNRGEQLPPVAGEPVAETPAPAPNQGRPDGAACLAPTDCASGACEGPGCDELHPGTCAPAWAVRQCMADQRAWCGCDGVTFHANVGCPGQRFRHEAECAAEGQQ